MMKTLGKMGEDLAAARLRQEGYQILERNWRCARGEIDMVAKDGHTLVFIEVKTRRSNLCGSAAEAVDPKKQERLRFLARNYLYTKHSGAPTYRFDVVAVNISEQTISIIKNAF